MAVEVLVTPEVATVLESEGLSGGLSKIVQDQLVKKLADITGKVEDKGGKNGVAFWGIDLPDANRAIFTLNAAHQPVLIYAGKHEGYDALNLAQKTPADFPIAAARPVTLESPKAGKSATLDEFNRRFSETANGFPADPQPFAPGGPANGKSPPPNQEADALLRTDREKMLLADAATGDRFVFDSDTDALITIRKNGSKTVAHGAEAQFSALQERLGGFEVISARESNGLANIPPPAPRMVPQQVQQQQAQPMVTNAARELQDAQLRARNAALDAAAAAKPGPAPPAGPEKFVMAQKKAGHASVIEDPVTGKKYIVKTGVTDGEIAKLQKASALEFPAELRDAVSIPKLVTTDKSKLPAELQNIKGNVAVMEMADGDQLKYREHGLVGEKPKINAQDWEKFKSAVAFMNENGVVHRDLGNTENIFISQDAAGKTHFEMIDWGAQTGATGGSDRPAMEALDRHFRQAGIVVENTVAPAAPTTLPSEAPAAGAPETTAGATPPDFLARPPKMTLESSVKYLAEARAFVANQPAPEGFRQIIHSNAAPVGDGTRPAIVDASYEHTGRNLVSVAFPDFVPTVPLLNDAALQRGVVEYNQGFNAYTLAESLQSVMRSEGLHPNVGGMKVGFDNVSKTNYVEFKVPPEEYAKARRIVDAFTRGDVAQKPELLLETLKSAAREPAAAGPITPDRIISVGEAGTPTQRAPQAAPNEPIPLVNRKPLEPLSLDLSNLPEGGTPTQRGADPAAPTQRAPQVEPNEPIPLVNRKPLEPLSLDLTDLSPGGAPTQKVPQAEPNEPIPLVNRKPLEPLSLDMTDFTNTERAPTAQADALAAEQKEARAKRLNEFADRLVEGEAAERAAPATSPDPPVSAAEPTRRAAPAPGDLAQSAAENNPNGPDTLASRQEAAPPSAAVDSQAPTRRPAGPNVEVIPPAPVDAMAPTQPPEQLRGAAPAVDVNAPTIPPSELKTTAAAPASVSAPTEKTPAAQIVRPSDAPTLQSLGQQRDAALSAVANESGPVSKAPDTVISAQGPNSRPDTVRNTRGPNSSPDTVVNTRGPNSVPDTVAAPPSVEPVTRDPVTRDPVTRDPATLKQAAAAQPEPAAPFSGNDRPTMPSPEMPVTAEPASGGLSGSKFAPAAAEAAAAKAKANHAGGAIGGAVVSAANLGHDVHDVKEAFASDSTGRKVAAVAGLGADAAATGAGAATVASKFAPSVLDGAADGLGRVVLPLAVLGAVARVAADPTKENAIKEGATLAGGIAGGELGATVGALGGPIGVAVGGVVGGIGGAMGAGKLVEDIYHDPQWRKDEQGYALQQRRALQQAGLPATIQVNGQDVPVEIAMREPAVRQAVVAELDERNKKQAEFYMNNPQAAYGAGMGGGDAGFGAIQRAKDAVLGFAGSELEKNRLAAAADERPGAKGPPLAADDVNHRQEDLLFESSAGGLLPKTVNLNGQEVPLQQALCDPAFNRDFRAAIAQQAHDGKLKEADAGALLDRIDRFNALEQRREPDEAHRRRAEAIALNPGREPTAGERIDSLGAAQTKVLADGLPPTVKIGDKEMKLADALKDPAANSAVRESMKDDMIATAKLDAFDSAEREKKFLAGLDKPAAPKAPEVVTKKQQDTYDANAKFAETKLTNAESQKVVQKTAGGELTAAGEERYQRMLAARKASAQHAP